MTANIERNQGIYVVDDADLKEPSSVSDDLVEKNAAKIVEIKKQIFDLLAEAESLAAEAESLAAFAMEWAERKKLNL